MSSKAVTDVEKTCPLPDLIAKLRRLADGARHDRAEKRRIAQTGGCSMASAPGA